MAPADGCPGSPGRARAGRCSRAENQKDTPCPRTTSPRAAGPPATSIPATAPRSAVLSERSETKGPRSATAAAPVPAGVRSDRMPGSSAPGPVMRGPVMRGPIAPVTPGRAAGARSIAGIVLRPARALARTVLRSVAGPRRSVPAATRPARSAAARSPADARRRTTAPMRLARSVPGRGAATPAADTGDVMSAALPVATAAPAGASPAVVRVGGWRTTVPGMSTTVRRSLSEERNDETEGALRLASLAQGATGVGVRVGRTGAGVRAAATGTGRRRRPSGRPRTSCTSVWRRRPSRPPRSRA